MALREHPNGFSLVELMVALAIAGLATAAVVLAMGDGRGGSAIGESERLAARLGAARDAAVIGGRVMAFDVSRTGYAFSLRRDGAWQAPDDRRLGAHAWPAGLMIKLNEGHRRVLFDSVGMASEALVIDLAQGGTTRQVRLGRDGAVVVLAQANGS